MQTDNNLVIYSTFKTPVWNTRTYGYNISCNLVMKDDGNLAIYDTTGLFRWGSNTTQSLLKFFQKKKFSKFIISDP